MRKSAMRELAEHIYVMDEINPSEISEQTPPVVSIYLPVEHTERDRRLDDKVRIEFKNLSNKAIKDMQDNWGKWDVKPVVEKLKYLQENEDLPLWIDAKDGLAIFVNKEGCYVYNMDKAPETRVTVSDKFDMGPVLSEAERDQSSMYKLLLLSADFFALLDGDDTSVRYVKFPDDVKHYNIEMYPEYDGKDKAPLDYYSLEDHMSPFHGHKSRNDVKKEETEKFFRYVNKVLNDKLLLHNTEPVILVTLPEHVHMFREICSFDHLYPKTIEKDPGALTGRQLRDDALALLGK